jgi:hypothetical protein
MHRHRKLNQGWGGGFTGCEGLLLLNSSNLQQRLGRVTTASAKMQEHFFLALFEGAK